MRSGAKKRLDSYQIDEVRFVLNRPELAQLSAEDWLQELTAIDALPASAREWRLITARASTRLASRLRLQIGLGAERIGVSNDSLTSRRKTFHPQRDQGADLSPSSQQLSAVRD